MYAAYRSIGWLTLAFLTNATLVLLILGTSGLAGYSIFVGSTVFGMALMLIYGKSTILRAGLASLLCMFGATVFFALIFAKAQGVSLGELYQIQIKEFSDLWLQSIKQQVERRELLDEEIRSMVGQVAPSVFIVFGILMIWANTVFLVRLNPRDLIQRLGLTPGFLRTFKAPEWLVWPTIAAAGVLLVAPWLWSTIALNILIVILTIYAFQGVAILVFFFDAFRFGPLLRILIFFILLTSLWPLLVAFGFFDLWFDFRKKLRQSS